jgi:hypothetical protein
MAKKFLKISDDDKFDFALIGIVCQHRDYRLCKELNSKFEIDLVRGEEYSVFNNKRMEDQSFSFFEYFNDEGDRYNLLSNKSSKGFLLPEQNQVDYLFLLHFLRMHPDEDEVISQLREIPIILGAYKLEATKLKSRENLVF